MSEAKKESEVFLLQTLFHIFTQVQRAYL